MKRLMTAVVDKSVCFMINSTKALKNKGLKVF